MSKIDELFKGSLKVINMGLPEFGENLKSEGVAVQSMDWRPPAFGEADVLEILDAMRAPSAFNKIHEANQKAFDILQSAQPTLMDVRRAEEVIPGMHKKMILHAGPPIPWERMCGPMRGAVIGGLIYEGLAADMEEAGKLAASGAVTFDPCHHHQTVGPMAGIVTASMPVFVLENGAHKNLAFCTLNEGLGKVLRYGAYSDEVLKRLKWMEAVLAPVLKKTIALHGPLDLKSLIAQALFMGDECHNRNKAATSLLIRELAPFLVRTGYANDDIAEVFRFIHGNDHFFLNLSMPASKCTVDPASNIPWSTIVYTMSRNGTDFGIRVSGTAEAWYIAPAPDVEGLYFPGFTKADANPDIGDSVITESTGIGAFAMASAPAIVQFVGGTPKDAIDFTQRMYEITFGENRMYRMPQLNFRGTPTGIDLLKVVETGITPNINTGIAHKEPGIGQVGAGLTNAPTECFIKAIRAFARKYLGKE